MSFRKMLVMGASLSGEVVKTNLEIISDSLIEEVRVTAQRWARLGVFFPSFVLVM